MQGLPCMVEWLIILLPVQGTRVWALVREDPTCRRATKPIRHKHWACALEPTRLELVPHKRRSHHNEKPVHRTEEQSLLVATRESPRTAMKTQHSQK